MQKVSVSMYAKDLSLVLTEPDVATLDFKGILMPGLMVLADRWDSNTDSFLL
jgi:hypothetical protein